ncbi:SNF2 domain-containing protein CLASSY 1-like [Andrographis paniculata]|uniref:SNF2 domain-containing protein CLASSY 1-like n=1 Tax=Andrographis paniculata TaxID=175694 RepID=UPI0021E955CB|nr:SNF2 domain-containing protein CLASSY 1-like [Andrographis paniculata]
MKRKSIYQTTHLFNEHPFEAFWCGSWHPVERLRIIGGVISTRLVDNGVTTEEEISMSHLRVKSRRATWFDCSSFLRPGIDICVLATSPNSNNSNAEPVWIDARLRSIERKPHDGLCDCQFHVSFYIDQNPDLHMENKRLSKETRIIKVDQIYILQRLEMKPCQDQFYRWGFTENCFSLKKFKFFTGIFCSDITWLIVASVQKKTAFDVRSLQNRLVYEVSEYNPDVVRESPQNPAHTLSFKVENDDILTPVLLPYTPPTPQEGSEGLEVGFLRSDDLIELRRSKRRNVQPDRYMGYDNPPDYEVEVSRLGESKTYKLEYGEMSSESEEYDSFDDIAMPLSVQADNEFQKRGGLERWMKSHERNKDSSARKNKSKGNKNLGGNKRGRKKSVVSEELAVVPSAAHYSNLRYKFAEDGTFDLGATMSKYAYMNRSPSSGQKDMFDFDFMEFGGESRGSKKGMRRKYRRNHSDSASFKKDSVYVRESIYDVRSFRKGSSTAQLCRDLIKRCMNNIDATLKNEPVGPPVLDQWKEIQSSAQTNKRVEEEKPPVEKEEVSEMEILFKEMDLALASFYLFDDNEDSHNERRMADKPEDKCKHDLRLDEQIGTVCQLCGFVDTDIRHILPPFAPSVYSAHKERRTEDETQDQKTENKEMDQFSIPAPSTTPSNIAADDNNVWALIPDLKDQLRSHQKKAFEFLWRNIAGSLMPSQMEKRKDKRGGCVISHTPGAGKTLLIIAFLVSYLKLFPGSRPLVLAPKTTLYTWYKEILKWKVPVPVYQIHGGQTYKGEVLKQRMKLAPGLPRNQDVMHVLDCLEKMQRWLSQPSILLMGYTSFLTLTREDSHYAHRKYMAQLLKRCPGILILDEGHNPRSTKSRLRKGLMKVDTRLRILLSGTLFQNNFGEYFNTLCLARPSFVHEVLKELDPKYESRNKERRTQFSLENRGRKLLIDMVSKKIDSRKGGEREEALKTLKKLTGKFIDVYEGGSSDNLPGLQCYTLMMKSTSFQQEILVKLQNQRPAYRGFPLELELLITLGAIHPWLIRTTLSSKNYFNAEELDYLEQFKYDIKSGSKIRFVMNLIPRCLLRDEKVLIFCHNIAPINLFLQIFEKFFGWRKGREVLVLQGDIELFERGRVMDKFEEPMGPSKIMLASITACAEGISLTAASRVILLDSEWNPSKSKQAIARAFRPGQNKVVYVYQLLATGTLEEEKHSRTTWKEWVSDMIFSDEHVEDPSHWQAPKIEDELLREIVEEDRAALFHKIMKNEKASSLIRGGKDKNIIN